MGRFRDRMDDDLRIRGYSANTRASYLRCVRHFVRHFMRPPDQLTPEHIRQYQLYLTRDRRVSWAYFNQIVCALRFFYGQVLRAKPTLAPSDGGCPAPGTRGGATAAGRPFMLPSLLRARAPSQ